jgi:hypothetical protein
MPKWPSQVQPLTARSLPAALASPRLVGIHCWAAWNGHDYEFAEQSRLILEGTACGMDLYSMDIGDNSNTPLMAAWEVLNVPAFIVFHQGKRLKTFFQCRESVAEFRHRIQHWLEKVRDDA